MNYKVIRENTDYKLKVGDFFEFVFAGEYVYKVHRNDKIVDSFNVRFTNILHEAKYLEPILERKVLKLEVEFEKIGTDWRCEYSNEYMIFMGSTDFAKMLNQLLAERDGENG